MSPALTQSLVVPEFAGYAIFPNLANRPHMPIYQMIHYRNIIGQADQTGLNVVVNFDVANQDHNWG